MDKEFLSLESAKEQFTKLMNSLDTTLRNDLVAFAIEKYVSSDCNDDESDEGSYTPGDVMDDPVALLNSIAKDLRQRVPIEAVLPSETIITPEKGLHSICNSKTTRHVDAFLYNDDELDDLVKEGKLTRNYCVDCGSANTKPLDYISHSTSREDLYDIFNNLLPPLNEKTVVDVGSRLGAVLYGAYAYTDAARIIGVEMNKELCELQNDFVRKYKMEKRVEVINKRIEDAADIVKAADVVILNNVFEFFLSESQQAEIWRFLRANVKSGARIISRPDISTAISNLNTGIAIDDWVKMETAPGRSKNFFEQALDNDEKSIQLASYTVL